MLVRINQIINKSKRTYIYYLTNSGKLEKKLDSKGFVCYDTNDLKNYSKTAKRGRPPKIAK